jgi:hypothetical protein
MVLASLAVPAGRPSGSVTSGRAIGGLTVELAALAGVGVAVATAAGTRSGRGSQAVVGALGPVLAAVLSLSVSRLAAWFWVGPGEPSWPVAHLRWSLVAASALLVIAWLSRDPFQPARASPRSRRPSGQADRS